MSSWLEGLGWGEEGRLTQVQALERYRYLVRTASPEMLELAHRHAFDHLAPEEQGVATRDLNAQLLPIERVPPAASADAAVFARAATRAELTEPGTLERAFELGDGPFAGSLLNTVVSSFIETAMVHGLLSVFDEADPVEAEAVEAADPGRDGAFGDDAEYGDSLEEAEEAVDESRGPVLFDPV